MRELQACVRTRLEQLRLPKAHKRIKFSPASRRTLPTWAWRAPRGLPGATQAWPPQTPTCCLLVSQSATDASSLQQVTRRACKSHFGRKLSFEQAVNTGLVFPYCFAVGLLGRAGWCKIVRSEIRELSYSSVGNVHRILVKRSERGENVKEPAWKKRKKKKHSINWIHVKIKLLGELSEGSNAFI